MTIHPLKDSVWHTTLLMYCDDTTLCVSATSAPAAGKATATMAATTTVMMATTTTAVREPATAMRMMMCLASVAPGQVCYTLTQ